MIPGPIDRESNNAHTVYYKHQSPIRATATGIFNPLVALKDSVSKGQLLAEIKDIKGDVIDIVKAHENGLIWILMTKRYVTYNDILFYALTK